MTSDEEVQAMASQQALEGLMLLINEHTDLSVLKPSHLYFLMEPHVDRLHKLVEQSTAQPVTR